MKISLEPRIGPYFLKDSYGYRPNKSEHDAIKVTRERCWKYSWVLEFGIKGLFDNIDHELPMKAVRKYSAEKWEVLYIERWLKCPIVREEQMAEERRAGLLKEG